MILLLLNLTTQIDPYLEAIMEINPDALHIAKELDEEREKGVIRGPLHGIPVLVKDVGDMGCPWRLTFTKSIIEHGNQRQDANDLWVLGFTWLHSA